MTSRSTRKKTPAKPSGKSAFSTRSSTPHAARDKVWGYVIVALLAAVIAALAWIAISVHPAKAEVASWYGPGFHGRLTANGERFDQNAMTCAHRTAKFGTVFVVSTGSKTATCRVNDRGPFIAGRDLDVSRAVAAKLGMIRRGVARVDIRKVVP